MRHTIPIRIGFIAKDKTFISVYTIYRLKANDVITFRKEKYKKINSDWDCYIKL